MNSTVKAVVAFGTVVALSGALDAAPSPTFNWPDSRAYSRVIVNATQGIETRPKAWFADDKLVTDYTLTNVDAVGLVEAGKTYERTRDLLKGYGLAVGTYVSGTTVIPEKDAQRHYPIGIVPLEWMPASARYFGTWSSGSSRKIVELADPETRHALQSGIQRLWKQFPAPVRFIDNAAVHRSAGAAQSWENYCRNIEELRQLGEAMGSRQIFNIAGHVGEFSDEEMSQLIRAVGSGGIMLEMPWHPNIQRDAAATERAKSHYRRLLDSGMAIILAPPGSEFPAALADWVRTWRKPTDRIYFGGAFYKQADPLVYGPGHSTK